jgi:hypothetical protein
MKTPSLSAPTVASRSTGKKIYAAPNLSDQLTKKAAHSYSGVRCFIPTPYQVIPAQKKTGKIKTSGKGIMALWAGEET